MSAKKIHAVGYNENGNLLEAIRELQDFIADITSEDTYKVRETACDVLQTLLFENERKLKEIAK